MKTLFRNLTTQWLAFFIYSLIFILLVIAVGRIVINTRNISRGYDTVLDSSINKLEVLRKSRINAEKVQDRIVEYLLSTPATKNENLMVAPEFDSIEKELTAFQYHLENEEEKVLFKDLLYTWEQHKRNLAYFISMQDKKDSASLFFHSSEKYAFFNFHRSITNLSSFQYHQIKLKDKYLDKLMFRWTLTTNALITTVILLLLFLGVVVFKNTSALSQQRSVLISNEKVLKESEALYKALFNNSPVLIWVAEIPTLKILDFNETALNTMGYSKDEFLSMNAYDLLAVEEREVVKDRLKKNHGSYSGYDKHVKKNGEVINVEIRVHVINYKGKTAGLVIGVDVTEKLKMEEELKKSEMKFRSLIENSQDGIALNGIDGRILYITPSVERILGYHSEEILNSDSNLFIHPDDKGYMNKLMMGLILLKNETRTAIYRVKHKNGEWRWVRSAITNMLHEPAVNAFVFNYVDITEARLTEQKIIESEADVRAILDNTNTAFYLVDTDFRIREFNQLSYDWVLEETGKELKKATFFNDYVREDRKAPLKYMYEEVLAGEEIDIELKGYKDKWYHVNMKRILGENYKVMGLCISSNDITEQKLTKEKTKNSEELYRFLFTNSPMPAWIACKDDLHFLEINNTAIEKYGYTEEEFLSMTAFDIRPPEERQILRDFMDFDAPKQTGRFYRQHHTKMGEILYVETYARSIRYKGKDAYLVLVNDISDRVQLQDQLVQEKVKKQKDKIKAMINGQEKERNELGKELHDNVNQILAVTKLYLDSASGSLTQKNEFLEKSRNLVNTCMLEIRKISKSLVPPSLGELTLKEALDELVSSLRFTQKDIDFKTNGLKEADLSNEVKISVYRIVQEQLNNIIKYAEASQIRIVLHQQADSFNLEIRDNGKGFDTNKKRNGIGITNMVNRASIFNGKVTIESSPGNGCSLLVHFELLQSDEKKFLPEEAID